MSKLVGLEVLHKLYSHEFESKADTLVALIHCLFINHDHKCIGLGVSWNSDEGAVESELLPDGWNSNSDAYTLRYITDVGKCMVKMITTAEEELMLTVMNVDTKDLVCKAIKIKNYTGDDFKQFSSAYKNLEEICEIFEEFVHTPTKKTVSGSEDKKKSVPIYEVTPINRDLSVTGRNRVHLYEVGIDDLDPFAQGRGGGMLYDPNFPEMEPRFSRPQGTRIYPTNPFGINSYRPDPDELQPPGFDYYM